MNGLAIREGVLRDDGFQGAFHSARKRVKVFIVKIKVQLFAKR